MNAINILLVLTTFMQGLLAGMCLDVALEQYIKSFRL